MKLKRRRDPSLQATLFVLAAVVCITGCSSSETGVYVPPDGAVKIVPFGTCSVEGGYSGATHDECGVSFMTCSREYYALCDGSTFAYCDCSEPVGGTLIVYTGPGPNKEPPDLPDAADEGGSDDGGIDSGSGIVDAAVDG